MQLGHSYPSPSLHQIHPPPFPDRRFLLCLLDLTPHYPHQQTPSPPFDLLLHLHLHPLHLCRRPQVRNPLPRILLDSSPPGSLRNSKIAPAFSSSLPENIFAPGI